MGDHQPILQPALCAQMAGHRLRCTQIVLLLGLVWAGIENPADGANKHVASSPSTQLLKPFAGSDDGWEQRSIKSSVDRMMGHVEEDDTPDEYVDDDLSDDLSDEPDYSDVDDDYEGDTAKSIDNKHSKTSSTSWDDAENNSFDYAPITKDADPLIAEVLPDSVKTVEKGTQARMDTEKSAQPSTHMEDNPLISADLKAQVKKEMGVPTTEENRDIEHDVTNVLVHERSHALQLEKELAKARADTAAAKRRQKKLERRLKRANSGQVTTKKHPLVSEGAPGKLMETAKRGNSHKMATKKNKLKKVEKTEVKKLLKMAKKNNSDAHKLRKKTMKRVQKWASKQVIDDPEDALKSFKSKSQEKAHKLRSEGDHRNHSGKWANKYDYYTDGYVSNNAYLDRHGHYHLGMSRRRIGSGFGRRRRGTGYQPAKWIGKVHSRMLRKIVKGHSLLKEGLKVYAGDRNIYGKGPKHPRKKKKLPPGIKEADKSKLTPDLIRALKKSGAGVNAKVDTTAHFTGKTIAKIGGKGLAASLGEKAKAAKKTAKLSAKVQKLVARALKKAAGVTSSKKIGASKKKGASKGLVNEKSLDKKKKKEEEHSGRGWCETFLLCAKGDRILNTKQWSWVKSQGWKRYKGTCVAEDGRYRWNPAKEKHFGGKYTWAQCRSKCIEQGAGCQGFTMPPHIKLVRKAKSKKTTAKAKAKK